MKKRMNSAYYFLFSLLFIVSPFVEIVGQENQSSVIQNEINDRGFTLDGLITKDKTLERGVYIIENNLKVIKGATLTFKAGSQILFKKGVSIKIEGGLVLEGFRNNMIEVKSENIAEEGVGFLFSGINNEQDVYITYTKFTHLLTPIYFEKNWTRRSVKIDNNVFKNIVIAGEPAIVVKSPDNIASLQEIPFSFSANNFIENNSRIYFENIESDVMKLKFKYNLITANYFYGNDVETNSPIYTVYNKRGYKYQADFLGNAFYHNFQRDEVTDTIIKEINFGIRGAGETLNLDGNFFGIKSVSELQNSFDHFTNYQGAPFIVANSALASPPSTVHGNIWRVAFNEEDLTNLNVLPAISQSADFTISVFSNRLFLLVKGISYLTYTFYDVTNKKIETKDVLYTHELDQEGSELRFISKDDVFKKNTIGYFTIKGLRDEEGFGVPKITIGRDAFIHYLFENSIVSSSIE